MAITVVIVDDHALMRSGVRGTLDTDPDISVIGEAADGREALSLVEDLQPDVLVLDIETPVMSGIEVTRTLVKRCPNTRVVILSAHDTHAIDFLSLTETQKARGYVLKDDTPGAILDAVRAVAQGRTWLSWKIQEVIARYATGRVCVTRADELTDRELDVLRLMVGGASDREAGQELGITPSTVRFHVNNVLGKLGCANRVEAAAEAVRRGICD